MSSSTRQVPDTESTSCSAPPRVRTRPRGPRSRGAQKCEQMRSRSQRVKRSRGCTGIISEVGGSARHRGVTSRLVEDGVVTVTSPQGADGTPTWLVDHGGTPDGAARIVRAIARRHKARRVLGPWAQPPSRARIAAVLHLFPACSGRRFSCPSTRQDPRRSRAQPRSRDQKRPTPRPRIRAPCFMRGRVRRTSGSYRGDIPVRAIRHRRSNVRSAGSPSKKEVPRDSTPPPRAPEPTPSNPRASRRAPTTVSNASRSSSSIGACRSVTP